MCVCVCIEHERNSQDHQENGSPSCRAVLEKRQGKERMCTVQEVQRWRRSLCTSTYTSVGVSFVPDGSSDLFVILFLGQTVGHDSGSLAREVRRLLVAAFEKCRIER